MHVPFAASAVTAFFFSPSTLSNFSTADAVNTTSGLILGHTAPDRIAVTEFLGIRYGQPPVGNLRFAAPRRYVPPAGTVYNASSWAPDCPANIPAYSTFPNFTQSGFRIWSLFTAHTGNPQDEDCLRLNVWTKTPLAKAKQPVFIWFHGGRFTVPGPHSPFYNGQYLSDTEDVVVVTSNYRLGIFGFSGAPGIEQNVALFDHRLVVEWVRDNIIGFGGDPSRIVLFGQSAGGTAVDYYSYAWKSDPIVAGLISHSGTALSFNPNNMTYALSIFYNVSETLGCGGAGNNPATIVACVRAANVSAVLAAAAKAPALPTKVLAQATFHPTVDDVVVFGNYETLSMNGSFLRIPYLLGNADYECGWYKLSAYAAKINLTESQWDLFNQRAFTCPTGEEAKCRVQYGVPTWRYRYYGDWDNLRLYDGSAGLGRRGSSVYHGTDIDMLFGTAYRVSGQMNTAEEDAAGKYMMGAWAAFARDPVQGLTKYGWPSYNKNGGCIFPNIEERSVGVKARAELTTLSYDSRAACVQ